MDCPIKSWPSGLDNNNTVRYTDNTRARSRSSTCSYIAVLTAEVQGDRRGRVVPAPRRHLGYQRASWGRGRSAAPRGAIVTVYRRPVTPQTSFSL